MLQDAPAPDAAGFLLRHLGLPRGHGGLLLLEGNQYLINQRIKLWWFKIISILQELDRAECKTAVAEKLLNSEELDSMDSEKLVSEQPVC